MRLSHKKNLQKKYANDKRQIFIRNENGERIVCAVDPLTVAATAATIISTLYAARQYRLSKRDSLNGACTFVYPTTRMKCRAKIVSTERAEVNGIMFP
jgi:hypothetical protein